MSEFDDTIEKILTKKLLNKDPKLVNLFETFVSKFGHDNKEARLLVESIVEDLIPKRLITEEELLQKRMMKLAYGSSEVDYED